MGLLGRRRERSERESPPGWSVWRPGRRVLVEHRDPLAREILERRLRARGYEAVGCGGPADDVSCPLLRQEPCPAVAGADAIVAGLDFRRDANRLVAARVAQSRTDCPIVLDSPDHVLEDWAPSFDFTRVHRMTAPSLISLLDDLFEESATS